MIGLHVIQRYSGRSIFMWELFASLVRRTFFTVASKSSLENGFYRVASGLNHGLRSNSCVGKIPVAMMTGTAMCA